MHNFNTDAPALRQDGESVRLGAREQAATGGLPPHRKHTSCERASEDRHRGTMISTVLARWMMGLTRP